MSDFPYHQMPQHLIDKAVEIRLWFAERNITEWAIGGIGPVAAAKTREQRTNQPLADPKLTVDVALKEADRCRSYADPVLNEMVIVVLADEIEGLRAMVRVKDALTDAARYRWLRAQGVSIWDTENFRRRFVSRCCNLDEEVDQLRVDERQQSKAAGEPT